jgi:hypothetical protein
LVELYKSKTLVKLRLDKVQFRREIVRLVGQHLKITRAAVLIEDQREPVDRSAAWTSRNRNATTIVLKSISFVLRALIVARVVLFLKLAFRLQPVVQLATVNSATFHIDLECSLPDLLWGWRAPSSPFYVV